MRFGVVSRLIGSFLQVYAAILLIPLLLGVYFDESLMVIYGYSVAAVACVFLGYFIDFFGESKEPTVKEAAFSTVAGWLTAVIIGAVPLLVFLNPVDAFFEAAAGLTTTGISVFIEPEQLPVSILFWRSFMQWIGGLGILTFFIAVIRESGGASRRLFSAESHKTDPGTVRPSLAKTIWALWKVYTFITLVAFAVFYFFTREFIQSVLHAFSVVSTGGFSTMNESIAGFNSASLEVAVVFLMLMGGTNFVLIYFLLNRQPRRFLNNTEFKTYIKIFLGVTAILMIDLVRKGFSGDRALIDSAFQSAAVVSSTGYSTISIMSFSIAVQALLIGVMFVGGSLGSTAGGFKVFRLKAMLELLKTRIRSYSLPDTAVNEVKIDQEIIEDPTIKTISVLFFAWVMVIFLATVSVIAIEDIELMSALSGTVSSAGNMGPVYMDSFELAGLSPVTKVIWAIVMLAGRLEMLPVLAIFNSNIFKDSNTP